MIDIVCEIILCFFAIFGVIDITKSVINKFCAKNIVGKYTILLDNPHEADIEYTIRYIESAIIGNDSAGIVSGITLGSNIELSPEAEERLFAEFGNLYYSNRIF